MSDSSVPISNPPKTAIITCAVLEQEFAQFAEGLDYIAHVELMEQGLHNEPERLYQQVQLAIDRIEADQPDVQAIVLGYGLCSRGTEGVTARRCKLVIARAHDCITLLLGSKERYAQYLAEHPGTYWYSPGWNIHHTPPGKERYERQYQQYVDNFGEDNAEYLMEMEQHWFKSYDRATFVDLGTSDIDTHLDYTRKCADWLGWSFDRQHGDTRLLRALLEGRWDDEDFVVLEPGHTIRMTDGPEVMVTVNGAEARRPANSDTPSRDVADNPSPNGGTSLQRVVDALDHRTPDAVPFDLGSTPTSGMHCSCVAALREHYGLEPQPVKVHEPYQMLGWIDDDLKKAIGVDTQSLSASGTIFGFTNEYWTPWRTPWGQEVLVSKHFKTTTDAGGDVFIYPAGDTTAPASGHMPVSGFFFDSIIRQPPIDDSKLDPADNLEEFAPVTDEFLSKLRADVQAASESDRAAVLGLPGMALGDIALVPAPFLRHPKGIRDISEWYMSTVTRQDYIHAVFEAQVRIAMDNLPRIHDAVGDTPVAVFLCGTDFGTQSSQFCSVETFVDLYKPYYQRMTDWIHQHTTWKVFKHSCGAVEPLMEQFIETGFDILNPVQCSATGMDPAHLKQTYGDRLVFWGGGVDTQQTLPFGTPQQVREQVLSRCETFAPGGGFVFNTIHNVQAKTPVANIVAMLDALAEFNGRR
ncbi:MAG: hypothetical protein CMJ49_10215 [Planctomycetaceae bacterium]|nr:hypothetical protein [Planctomycetaceae bacterium]